MFPDGVDNLGLIVGLTCGALVGLCLGCCVLYWLAKFGLVR